MTISSLKKVSNSNPITVSSSIISWTFNNLRFWLNACLVYKENDDEIALST